jgi:multisubunit Na+/H+ antiporter MnhB subunit
LCLGFDVMMMVVIVFILLLFCSERSSVKRYKKLIRKLKRFLLVLGHKVVSIVVVGVLTLPWQSTPSPNSAYLIHNNDDKWGGSSQRLDEL